MMRSVLSRPWAFVLACVFITGCGEGPPRPDIAMREASLEGDFALADGSVMRFRPGGRVGIIFGGKPVRLGRFDVDHPGLLRLQLFDFVNLNWQEERLSFLLDQGFLSFRPLIRAGSCGHIIGVYALQSRKTSMSVWGVRSEVLDDVTLELFGDGRAVLSGRRPAQGRYEITESGDVTMRVPGLPSILRIVQPRFRALANVLARFRPVSFGEAANLPEPEGLGTARVSFISSFPPAGMTGASLAVTVRDGAGADFLSLPDTPYDPAAMASAARPMVLPVPEGVAVIEASVGLRDARGAARCFTARASFRVAHAEEREIELTPLEAVCAP